jgi:hypothetical protein
MKNKNLFYFLLIFILATLNSCSNIKKAVGIEKDIPNEFLIEKRDSLSMPPDYKILPPGKTSQKETKKKSDSSLSSIFDKNLNQKKSSNESISKDPKAIENEILKEFK